MCGAGKGTSGRRGVLYGLVGVGGWWCVCGVCGEWKSSADFASRSVVADAAGDLSGEEAFESSYLYGFSLEAARVGRKKGRVAVSGAPLRRLGLWAPPTVGISDSLIARTVVPGHSPCTPLARMTIEAQEARPPGSSWVTMCWCTQSHRTGCCSRALPRSGGIPVWEVKGILFVDQQQAVYGPFHVSRLRVIDMSRVTKDEVAAF